ncbi:DNA-directed RNA polymerase subunit beta [Lysinibacillus endophyticus]|uniref:DNA-directed RNA polymerase subunit beta n=1 Tax=Ureibacillus endophyticus TaxID=1978490 RepID=A0A494Z5B0_9BACL|nr:DNA-directed RNA polymerase subunit beta [Lysinibacillus endophyticus]MCP1143635.1 DNA-directed RNA polymerase subunit beta [Lysinibacillus endophyticus]RKQ17754.1 DNA-directed RNA polymerase subunit beta [Lysinibacillus endophyticus]
MTNDLKSNSLKPNVPQEEKEKRTARYSERPIRFHSFRLFPIWLRLLIVFILLFLAICFGVMIGYGVIGDGKPLDALKWGTWQHILDIINGKE